MTLQIRHTLASDFLGANKANLLHIHIEYIIKKMYTKFEQTWSGQPQPPVEFSQNVREHFFAWNKYLIPYQLAIILAPTDQLGFH